jgi:predicted DNA-binding transcriptional regulator AlpA
MKVKSVSLTSKVLLSRSDLRRLGVQKSNVTLIRWEDAGLFPRRLRTGGSVAWLSDEILKWIESCTAERENFHHEPRR